MRASIHGIVAVALLFAFSACGGDATAAANEAADLPRAEVQLRLIAPETGDWENLSPGEFPRDGAQDFKWLPLRSQAAVSSPLVKEHNGKSFVPVQVSDEFNVTGADIINIRATTDERSRMGVSFDLTAAAIPKVEDMTRQHMVTSEDPRQLALIVDGVVFNAFTIQGTISKTVQLSGAFNVQERDELVRVLNAGTR